MTDTTSRRESAELTAGTSGHSRAGVTMLVNLAFTAGAGFLYWLLVARAYPSDEVGRAGALATSAMLVVFCTNLGLTVAVGRHAGSRHGDDDARFTIAAVLTVMSSVIGALVLFAIGPDRVMRAIGGTQGWSGEVLFMLIVAFIPLAQLADIRLLALRRRNLVIARSGTAAVLKVALAVVVSASPTHFGSVALFAGLLVPDALLGLVAGVSLAAPGARRMLATRALPPLRAAYQAARVNYASVLLVQGTTIAVPFVVIPHVTDTQNANFYLAWSFTQMAFLVPQAVSWGLHVEGVEDDVAFGEQVRSAMRHAIGLSVLATVASVSLVVLMPAMYGDEYVTGGRIAPLLMACSIPFAVTVIHLAEARVIAHFSRELVIAATFALLVVGSVVVLVANLGIDGAVTGVVLGTVASAAVSTMVATRPSRSTDLSRPDDTFDRTAVD